MSNDKLQKWALTAEILGGIAIVVSLVFVGVQLRESVRATKSATANAATAATSAWYTSIGNSTESSSLFYQYMTNFESLTAEQRYQAVMNLHGVALTSQSAFYLFQQGTLDPDLESTIAAPIRAVKHLPGWVYFWDNRGSMFNPEFQRYVEDLMTSDETHSEDLYLLGRTPN
jgi:hypothetical protein